MKTAFRFAMLALILVVVAMLSGLTAMRFAIHDFVIDAIRCDFDIRPIGGVEDSLGEGMDNWFLRDRRIEHPGAVEGALSEGAGSQQQQNEKRFHPMSVFVVVMISLILEWMPISR